jgi:uncharacterized protein (DUF427 family)
MSNSGPGYQQKPNHLVTTSPAGVRVQVSLRGELIADTRNAVQMDERPVGYEVPVVYYIPRQDVKMDRLVRSTHQTYCPFKGQASYYSFVGGPENAIWTYEQPYDEVMSIKEHLAFYPDQVELKVT